MNKKTRLQTVLKILLCAYPKAHIALSYDSHWELLVAVILSAQCTDAVVNKVTEKLFKKYSTLEAYCRADLSEFEKDIKSTGFYHNKAKNILNAAKMVVARFGGVVPKTMNGLLAVPGVARKTANVVLGNAYGVVEGIAVDTHVIRLSQRLRLVPLDKIGGKKRVTFPGGEETRQGPLTQRIDYIKDASPEKIEAELMKTVPKSNWFGLTYQLINHGRSVCRAQNPKCGVCPLVLFCPAKR